MNPYWAMFQAGAVAPSSALLLHEDTEPLGFPDWEPFEPPVKAGDIARPEEGIAADGFVGLAPRPYTLCLIDPEAFEEIVPEADGVNGAPDFFGPMVVLNVDGFAACACREKAPRHCNTCAGSFDSNKSTVKNRSCDCILSGGISQAFKK